MGGDSTGDVELFVTVVGRVASDVERAVVHMPGGPGASAESYAPVLASTYLPLSDAIGRPIVFVDQRGTGRSTPFLDCADVTAPAGCLEAWAADGIDPLAFTTPRAADDIAAVARALGLTSIDAWGASYGSRLALETARRHADLVRSLVIESVDTADSPLDDALDVRAALGRAGEECADDPACAAVVPDLVGDVDAVSAALEDEPFITGLGAIDTATFLSDLTTFMMWSRGTSYVPAYVAAVRARDVAAAEALRAAAASAPFPGGRFSEGMYVLVNCTDLAPFDPAATVAGLQLADADRLGRDRAAQTLAQYDTVCAGWPVDPDAPTEPVSTDVPTLVLRGAIDSNTPAENAELAAATLVDATVVTFASTGHFPVHQGGDPCGESILVAFLSDPSAPVDTSCIGGARPVATLPPSSAVTLRPTTIPSIGITAEVPDGWVTLDGSTWRTAGAVLQLALLPGEVADVASTVAGQVGLADDASTAITVGGVPWTRFSGPGTSVLLVQADTAVLVVLVALSDGSDADAFALRIAERIVPA